MWQLSFPKAALRSLSTRGLLCASLFLAAATRAEPAFLFHTRATSDVAWQITSVKLLQSAQQPWKLCVILPNLSDSYWSLVRYGIEQQARSLNLSLTLIEASGYDAVQQQADLIDKRCITTQQDALILAAVDHSALNGAVRKARSAGLAVIDLINGISTPEVSARVAVDYGDLAYDIGRYMAEFFPDGRVIWQPGPASSAWTGDANRGLLRALEGRSQNLVHSYHALPFVREQHEQLQRIVQQYRFNRVVGTAVTAEAAVSLLDQMEPGTEIFSYYYNPKIHPLIGCGRIQAALYDYPALQGRVAVDQAVRILEHQPFDFHLATARLLLTRANLAQVMTVFDMPPALLKQLQDQGCGSP